MVLIVYYDLAWLSLQASHRDHPCDDLDVSLDPCYGLLVCQGASVDVDYQYL